MRGAAKRIIQLARSICHAHTCCYSAVIFVASNWNFFLKYGKHRWGRDLCIVQRRVDENDSPLHWPCLLFVRQGSNLRPHAKNINLHASQLSGGSKQTGASYQFSVFSIQYSVFCFEFSVFSFSISFAQTLVLLFRHKDARTNGDTLEMGHDIPKESHMAQKDLFCFSLKYHTNH